MVTPSYMLSILDEFRRRGVDPRSTSLRHGIFGAEPWTEIREGELVSRCGQSGRADPKLVQHGALGRASTSLGSCATDVILVT